MWGYIIEIIEALSPELLEKIALSIKDANLLKLIKLVKSAKTTYDTLKKYLNLLNPQNIINRLLKLPKNILNKLFDEKIKNYKDIHKSSKSKEKVEKDFLQYLSKETRNTKKTLDQLWADYNKTGTHPNKTPSNDYVALSSSWVKFGKYSGDKHGFGVLTIIIISDNYPRRYGPYVYPGFPLWIWDRMLLAVGKNGTGAGSVMWRYFLRGWLNSNLRIKAYKNLAKISANPEIKNKLEEMVRKMKIANARHYAKNSKSPMSGYVDTKWWKEYARKENERIKKRAYSTYKTAFEQQQEKYKEAKQRTKDSYAKYQNAKVVKRNVNSFIKTTSNVLHPQRTAKRIIKKTLKRNKKPLH